MSDVINQGQNGGTPPTTEPSNPVLDELRLLEQSGEDLSDLQSDLESFLQEQKKAEPKAEPKPDPSPDPQHHLPIDKNGDPVELRKEEPKPPVQTEQTQQPAPDKDKAFDPYAPDNGGQRKADGREGGQADPADQTDPSEPGEMVVDQDGKLRDARTGRYVPHQALHAERTRRQELEREMQKVREENARAAERLNLLTEIMQGQQQATQTQGQDQQQGSGEEEDIDPEQNIFGAHLQLRKRYDTLMKELGEIKSQQTSHQSSLQIKDAFRQDATNYANKTPDFIDAVKYLSDVRRAELEVLGYTDKAATDRQLAYEQQMLINQAYKKQESPSDLLYRMAKAKGWKTPEPKPADPAPAQPPVQQQPQQQQTQPPLQVNPQSAQHIQNLQNGVQANASLSGAGGTPGEGLTVEALANMGEEEFMNLAAKLGKTKLDSLLKGG